MFASIKKQCNLYWSFRPCQKSKKNAQMKKRQQSRGIRDENFKKEASK